MKTLFLFIISFFLLTGCNSVNDSRNGLTFKKDQTAILIGNGNDEDYKRIQAEFSNQTIIDWKEVKPRLDEIEDSIIAKRISYLLDKDLIRPLQSVMVRCCGGCAIAVPRSCSECDFVCDQEKDFLDFLDFDF